MRRTPFFLLLVYSVTGGAATFSGDDKFLKKYAMMKVYESCFGMDVVKEVRMEMKAAASKCAGISPSGAGAASAALAGLHLTQPLRLHSSQSQHQSPTHVSSSHRHKVRPQSMESEGMRDNGLAGGSVGSAESAHKPLQSQAGGTLDLEKLKQAIMAGYNKVAESQLTSVGQQQAVSFGPAQAAGSVYSSGQPSLRPGLSYGGGPLSGMPGLYPGAAPAGGGYLPTGGYGPQAGGYIPGAPAAYPGQPYLAYPPQPLYPVPHYPAYYHARSSRDLDVRGQLETLANRVSGRVRNVTCVMQELGYLDANLEPDYGRMVERIRRLPVVEDLKRDMAEGVDFCRQFSQCVPDDRKDKLIQEMVRPMFFFRCYKHKKLEACIMKDVRERYNSQNGDELTEDNLTADSRSAKEFPEDNMATAIYEFLYGGDNIDIDTLI